MRRQDDMKGVHVVVDSSATPELASRVESLVQVVETWHGKICSILAVDQTVAPRKIFLLTEKDGEANRPATTSGNKITLYEDYFSKYSDEKGVVVHELVHVIQSYPCNKFPWVTEGIADYIRFACFEERALRAFPICSKRNGYAEGYQHAAGFFLWLEAYKSPGIVRKLNESMRGQRYSNRLFEQEAGKSLTALWDEYSRSRRKTQ